MKITATTEGTESENFGMGNNLGLHYRYNSYRVCFGEFDTVFITASGEHNAIVYASHDHPDLVNLCKSRKCKITAVLA